MRIVTLIMVIFVLATSAFSLGPQKFAQGISKLTADAGTTVLQDEETGRLRYVTGHLSDPVPYGQEADATFRFLAENKSAYLMKDPAEEVTVKRVDLDKLGMRHVRMAQQYKGVPVYGSELIAHFSKDNALEAVNGTYVEGIEVDPTPQKSSDEAVRIALSDLKSFFGAGQPNRPELIIFPWEGQNYLAWRFELFSDSPMGRWEYFVDANTGEVIFKANRIKDTEAVGTGTGVMGSARTHIDTDKNGSQYRMIDYTREAANNPHGHNGQMPAGNNIRTYVASTSLPGTLATDADNVWNAPSQASSVDGHVYSALVYDWLLATLGRNSFDNAGGSMIVSVDYSAEGNNNAYWNGSQMVVWSWGTGWRSLAGCPDVIAHEWGHAVTDYESGLIYQKESGALNESFSDMMGAAFEFAHAAYDTPDWYVGENGIESGGYFRDMSDPPARFDPDYYNGTYWVNVTGCTPVDANDYCGVHTNSGVGNKWFYLLSDGGTHHSVTVTGIGVANAIQIAYRANSFYWTQSSNYSEAAYGTVLSARDLDPSGAWEQQVRNGWQAVGVSMPTSYLVFSYPSGLPSLLTPEQTATFQVQMEATYDGSIVAGSGRLHYRISGGSEVIMPMTQLTPNTFEGTLPAVNCSQYLQYRVEASETTWGQFFAPSASTWYLAEPGTDQVVVFTDDFETNKGWTAGAGWARGAPTGGGGEHGGPDPSSAYSGTNVYGFNLSGDYEDYMSERYLTSPAINCSGLNNVHIDFQRWLGVEQPAYDHASIRVSTNGSTWTTVWENEAEIADLAWAHMDVNISSVASGRSTVYVRFTMGTTDGGWRYCGWNVDDFQITAYECNLAVDSDGDGIPDLSDNCPSVYNPTQADADGDAVGDACDRCPGFNDAIDADGDTVPDGCDICAGHNDLVDTDTDGVPNGCDNCSSVHNPTQADADGDGVGDACDRCPGFNDAIDADGDTVPDGCDQCAGHNDLADADADGVPDGCDNCPTVANPGQEDANNDNIGDACCCQIRVGDANGFGTYPQEVTISDIQTLVSAKFVLGTCNGIVPCLAEGDVNQTGGTHPTCNDITISDIQMLVNHLFIAGPANAPLNECL